MVAESVKNNILEKLSIFDNIGFDPEKHKYWFNGVDINPDDLRSATTISGSLHKPFDSDYWAVKKAKDKGCTKEMILEEWNRKSRRACDKGTLVHYYMECNLSGKDFVIPEDLAGEETVEGFNRTKPAADRFLEKRVKSGELIPIRSEVKVGVPGWKVVGTIDQLFLDRSCNLWIYDWKTNGKFTTENKWDNLLEPFDDCPDTNLHIYSVQLSIYRLILEYIGLRVAGCCLVWLPEISGVHREFNCFDFRDRAMKLLAV